MAIIWEGNDSTFWKEMECWLSMFVVFGVAFPQCTDVDKHNNTDKKSMK